MTSNVFCTGAYDKPRCSLEYSVKSHWSAYMYVMSVQRSFPELYCLKRPHSAIFHTCQRPPPQVEFTIAVNWKDIYSNLPFIVSNAHRWGICSWRGNTEWMIGTSRYVKSRNVNFHCILNDFQHVKFQSAIIYKTISRGWQTKH